MIRKSAHGAANKVSAAGIARFVASTATRRNQLQHQLIRDLAGTAPEDIVREIVRHGLIGVALPRLSAATKIDGALLGTLTALAADARRLGAVQHLLTTRLVRALMDAGIVTLPLKGQPLAVRLYGLTGTRQSGDIDILVRHDQLRSATTVLRDMGYQAPRDRLDREGRPTLHHVMQGPAGWPDAELHWRIHWYATGFSAQMLERARPRPVDGILEPSPGDELTALLLYYARDGFAGLKLACDIAAFADHTAFAPDPPVLADVVAEHPELRASLTAAATVAERVVGFPADRHLGVGLAGPLDRRRSLAIRLTNWRALGTKDQRAAEVALIDGLLCPPGGLAGFVQRQLISPYFLETDRAPVARVVEAVAHLTMVPLRWMYALLSVGLRRRPEPSDD